MSKKYILEENDLISLLYDSLFLEMLQSAGVDNWIGYCDKDAKKDLFEEYLVDFNGNIDEYSIMDCAKALLKSYE